MMIHLRNLWLALAFAYPPAAFAGPTPCQPTSGDVVCSGNQSNGVHGGSDFQTNNTYSLTVNNLTTDITPTVGSGPVYGIQWSLTSLSPQTGVTETFSSPDHSVNVLSLGNVAAGIDLDSHGSPNGSGRILQLNVNGSASASGTGGAAANGFVSGNAGSAPSGLDGSSGGDGYAGGGLDVTVGPTRNDPIAHNGELGGSGDTTSGIAAIGKGGGGGDGAPGAFTTGGNGGAGGIGGNVNLTVSGGNWQITSNGTNAPGVLLQSNAGNGGNGGNSGFTTGGHGGTGGQGGEVSFDSPSAQLTTITSHGGPGSPGLLLISQAGSGGTGGSGELSGQGGSGGPGGGGGPIEVTVNHLDITTNPNSPQSPGLAAYSLGGTGGNGGDGGYFNGGSGDGGGTGPSGPVTVKVLAGTIQTTSANSAGIIAQSIAGHAGTGGSAIPATFANFGADGGSAGKAGTVIVTNGATIRTNSDQSVAVFAQSAGGGGGNGGGGFGIFYSGGGDGGNGGDGGLASVTNTGSLTTSGADSQGIFAESVGGAGGDGGVANSVFAAIGGRAKYGSNGSGVIVENSGSISTGADHLNGVPIEQAAIPICGVGCSQGILAQSIGGGGGNGGAVIAEAFSLGGTGGGGGDGATVDVTNTGNIVTRLVNSPGIEAQSTGGGGGNGGGGVAAGLFATATIGGSGGDGGKGGPVHVAATSGMTIQTKGADSAGVFAQSTGGGGGNGGYAASVALGPTNFAFSVGVGGTGGKGGNAEDAVVTTVDTNYKGPPGMITTAGDSSDGIFAQSVGGGGGNGGFAVSVASAAEGLSVAFAMGGSGGVAGNGGPASLTSDATVTTTGDKSVGLFAQSLGGGGGNGGFDVSGDFQLTGVGVSVAVGGSGNAGGSAGNVTLVNSGTVTTSGTKADGVLAQSTGGGGGDGSVTVAASGAGGGKDSGNIALAVGGDGGLGGNAGPLVKLTNNGAVTATGPQSRGVVAESIGGGGGDGSLTIAAAITGMKPHELTLAIGGDGGVSGNGGDVELTNTAAVQTGTVTMDPEMAKGSPGIVASSGGGGEGHGSWIGSLAFGAGAASQGTPFQAAIAVGGSGGAAGNAGKVTLDNSGNVTTYANESAALLGSSIGGGGGDAGYVLAGTGLLADPHANGGAVTVAVGRDGGGGGLGGIVDVTNTGATLKTLGTDSDAIHARSEGGGGGDAGVVLAFTATTANYSIGTNVAVGGGGGSGSSASAVSVENSGPLTTAGQNSYGIRAQSVGGTGGDGAFALSGDVSTNLNQGVTANVAVGGNGGTGNIGGDVTVTSHGPITTGGDLADGIFAQSAGGGGGSARWTMAVGLRSRVAVSLEVGGDGGTGGNAGEVQVENYDDITTTGAGSPALVAQSVGGGGGFSQATSVGISGTASNNRSVALGVTVGATGAMGGEGGPVTVFNNGVITTSGIYVDGVSPSGAVANREYGIFAQSIGGGGGSGGSSTSLLPGLTSSDSTYSATVDVGGTGGQGGVSKAVTVTNTGAITTFDTESHGIYAQSIGGGGGSGGAAAAAPGILKDGSNKLNINIAVGGHGGTGNTSDVVTVDNAGSVTTNGNGSHGVFAQSIGGGGGDGGSAFSYLIGVKSTPGASLNLGLSLGGSGGTSGDGNTVHVTNSGSVTTNGNGANGIEAQSVGGGGGEGGNASNLSTLWKTADLAVGGKGGESGNAGVVTVIQTPGSSITTTGGGSSGIYAQSVGGGGGRGGVGVYAPIDTVIVGGSGGANGNGGAVTVKMQGGTIATGGSQSAYGIFAQSVGGGGGQDGGLGIGIIDTPFYTPPPNYVGIRIPMGSGDSSGNGGPVTVTMSGSITTTGDDAVGIFAQSVGGGGGMAGQDSTCVAPCSQRVGSVGANGSAGMVSVTLEGTITTGGQYSHGIFAQSAGGSASPAGNVSVTIAPNSAILVNGTDANAIFAQSAGGTNGAIDVTIYAGGMVQGGSGDSSSGIHFLDGTGNTLDNAGTITTLNGANGLAVRSDGGGVAVTNTGSIIGGVDLNGSNAVGGFAPERITNAGRIIGTVQIQNQDSVIINGGSGNTFGHFSGGAITIANGNLVFAGGNTDLADDIAVNGGAGKVTNNGVLRLAGPETIAGNFVQTASGAFETLIGGDAFGQYGALTMTGYAALEGRIELDPTNGFALSAGDSFDLFSFGDPGLTIPADAFRVLAFDGVNCRDDNGGRWSCSNLRSLDLMETISANSLEISVVASAAVPEPPSLVMLATGVLGLAGIGRLRRRRERRAGSRRLGGRQATRLSAGQRQEPGGHGSDRRKQAR